MSCLNYFPFQSEEKPEKALKSWAEQVDTTDQEQQAKRRKVDESEPLTMVIVLCHSVECVLIKGFTVEPSKVQDH